MNLSHSNLTAFKSALPVWCYARDPESKEAKYFPVVRPKNMDKCFNFIVRNLNNTAGKDNKNDEFIKTYSQIDKDYASSPISCSVTKTKQQYGFLFTGDNDVSLFRNLGKKLGHERAYNKSLIDNEGTYVLNKTDSFESKNALNEYFEKALEYTKQKGMKMPNGTNLGMKVYFDAVYKTNKFGEKVLKGFKYNETKFIPVEFV